MSVYIFHASLSMLDRALARVEAALSDLDRLDPIPATDLDLDAPSDADLAEYAAWLAGTDQPAMDQDAEVPAECLEDGTDYSDDAETARPWWVDAPWDEELDAAFYEPTADQLEWERRLDAMAEGTIERKARPVDDTDQTWYAGVLGRYVDLRA